MSHQTVQDALRQSNVPVLANAVELGAAAIIKVAGNAISNQVDGREVSLAFLHSALASRLQSLAAAHVGVEA